jgi:hypothetical protein
MKSLLAASALSLALAIELPSLVDDDVLEPSVRNEVDHALSRAEEVLKVLPDLTHETRLYCATNDVFGTNALDKTACAIRLVSLQKPNGRWYSGTNDLTRLAVEILEAL